MRQWRLNFVLVLIFLFGAAILAKLFFIQIQQHEYWKALAQGQQKSFTQVEGDRGEIFLTDSKKLIPLAVNKNWEFVYLSPAETADKEQDPQKIAKLLAETLNLDENSVLEKVKKTDSLYELVKNKLTEEEISRVKELNLPGVYLGKETKRYYPQDSLASQIVGFVGGDNAGQYGVEEYYNNLLAGREGFQEGEKWPGGYLFRMISGSDQAGSDLILTLDYSIQFKAEELLKKAKETLDMEAGQIIVGDPYSGKIVALANFPNFNLNEYSKETNLDIFQNSVIQKVFEPGSVFKPITMAAALEAEKITPQTEYVDEGFVKIGGYTIYNFAQKTWGRKTMTEVLERSINTGAIFAERQIGHDVFLNFVEKFGLFEPTGIDLAGEIFSVNSNLKKGYEVNFATASFGQGIEITPIQLFRAFCAIANGGKLIKPYIVENSPLDNAEGDPSPLLKGEGSGKARYNKVEPRQVVSQKTTSQLTAMLVSVVENGFSKKAKIPGYYIAGKTGTAQVSWSALDVEKAGYSDKTVQTFVGFAPAFNPRFVIMVKLDNPKASTAEYSAMPIFRDLAEYIINLWQIPPDYQEEAEKQK